MTEKTGKRIPLLDEVRGFAILCMVGYHFCYDLIRFSGVEFSLFESPLMSFLQNLFAGLFVAVAGGCCLLSRNNWKRGGLCLLAALLVKMGAGIAGVTIWFGVLDLLGCCMLLAALLEPALTRIPAGAGLLAAGVLFLLTFQLPEGKMVGFPLPPPLFASGALYPLGLPGEGFYSADYFPIFPWGMVFSAGYFGGKWIMAKGIPPFAMKSRSRFLAFCGRKTLLLYLLHQPVLMGFLWLLGAKP